MALAVRLVWSLLESLLLDWLSAAQYLKRLKLERKELGLMESMELGLMGPMKLKALKP